MANYITHAEDPRIPEGMRIRTLKNRSVSYKRWMLPLSYGHITLKEGNDFLKIVAAPQGQIPEIIRWTEGKDSHLVKEFFYGGVDLQAHDFAHLLLGRGLLPKDEAFVIGFTMGSTNRLASMNQEVFAYIAQHYYPNAYQMDTESRTIYYDAAKLGYLSDCQPLDKIDFQPYLDMTIDEVRNQMGLFPKMLEAYYRDIESRRHPKDPASSRLVEVETEHNPWRFSQTTNDTIQLASYAKEIKHILTDSDQKYSFDHKAALSMLNNARSETQLILKKQKDVAQMCFGEIRDICGKENEQVIQDHQQHIWDTFFQNAEKSVSASYDKVVQDLENNLWETDTDVIGKRAYVHALLNREDTPRDRAFCRGFYDGSNNKKTSYAADMKAQLLSQALMTLDGHYSADMQQSYKDGVRMGFISDCIPLCTVDFDVLKEQSIEKAREQINLTISIIDAYTEEVENKRKPST